MEYETLGLAWVNCMSHVLNEGLWEIDGAQQIIEKMNLYYCITDFITEDEIIEKYADKERISLMRKKHVSQEIIKPFVVSYGKSLYCNQGVNQIEHLIKKLKDKRETKSATISLHIPGESYATCLSLLDCKIRNESLHFTAVYRSQNIYGSQPGNLISLADVHKKIANATNSRIGTFNLYIMSAHIYEQDISAAHKIIDEVLNHG